MPDLLPSPTATIHAPAFRAHDNFRSEVDTSDNFVSEVDTNNGSNGPNGSKGAAVSHAAANDENAAPPKPTFGARKSLCNWNYCASNDEEDNGPSEGQAEREFGSAPGGAGCRHF